MQHNLIFLFCHMLRCQIDARPHLLTFWVFPAPRNPRLLILKKMTLSANSLFYLHSVLVPFMPTFQGTIACFLYILASCRTTACFCCPSLYNNCKPFLKFQPPPFISTPLFSEILNFFPPPCLLEPPIYLELESKVK